MGLGCGTKMEYKGYLGKVEYDDEAGIFHGEVVNLRDVITFTVRVAPEVHRAVSVQARLANRSLNSYVSDLLEQNLQQTVQR
jgi:predicted HicB family RNase H-like nuclease